jgi:hypothetical protein
MIIMENDHRVFSRRTAAPAPAGPAGFEESTVMS